jgi:hypothetical protein
VHNGAFRESDSASSRSATSTSEGASTIGNDAHFLRRAGAASGGAAGGSPVGTKQLDHAELNNGDGRGGESRPRVPRLSVASSQYDSTKVSVLLFTVTFHANLAHNLTRPP